MTLLPELLIWFETFRHNFELIERQEAKKEGFSFKYRKQ